MKAVALASCLSIALASFVLAGCSGASDDSVADESGASTEGLSGAGSATGAYDKKPDPTSPSHPVTTSPPKPTPASGGKPTPASGDKPDPVSPGKPVSSVNACPKNERLCALTSADGTCSEKCVPAGVICAAHTCPISVCDPAGPPPHAACSWDPKACEWSCPVCDPAGPPPKPGCKWDSKACEWLCL